MIGLLIVCLCALVVGKIHGQETVVSYVIHAQNARTSLDRTPTVIQDISRQLEAPPTRVIEILVEPAEVELYKPQLFHGSDFNLPQSTVRANQAQRTHILSQKITNMEGANNSNNEHITNNSSMTMETEKPKIKPTRPDSLPLPAGNETTINTFKSTIVKDLPPTNVTLDERASFSGDKCPTGYVKLNGKCVEME